MQVVKVPFSVTIVFLVNLLSTWWVVGSGDGTGSLPVPGRPTTFAYGRAGACCVCSRCGTGGLFLYLFHLVYPIFLF